MSTSSQLDPQPLSGRHLSLVRKQSVAGDRGSHTSCSMTQSGVNRGDNRLIINVGGVRHETYKTTLQNIPDTRLAWLTETASTNNTEYDPTTGEYFFDRHPGMFIMILNYYRTGKLHAPMDVCGPLFEEELAFWGIDENQLEACCWTNYRTHRDAQETLAELNGGELEDDWEDDEDDIARRFGIEETNSIHDDDSCRARLDKIRSRVWTTIEDPSEGGLCGKIMAAISIFVILASIILICVETLPTVRATVSGFPSNFTLVSQLLTNTRPDLSLSIIDYIFTSYFTAELLIRVFCAPDLSHFFCTTMNWIDIIALACTYAVYGLNSLPPGTVSQPVIESIGLPRVVRILKLARHFSGLKIFYHTIKASMKELFLLLIVFLNFVVLFGSFVFVFEQYQDSSRNQFTNMGYGYWWALVTMTTVGYGDFVPTSFAGYIVGVFCNVCGILVIAMPVPIIVNNFALYYTHAQARLKMPKRRRRKLVGAHDALKQISAPENESPASIADSDDIPTPTLQKSVSPDRSLESLRKTSNESGSPSIDSGIKTSSNNSADQCGISVVFTDDPDDPPEPGEANGAPIKDVTPSRRILKPDPGRRRSSVLPNGGTAQDLAIPTPRRGDPSTSRRSSFRPGLASTGSSPGSFRHRSQLSRIGPIPSVDIT